METAKISDCIENLKKMFNNEIPGNQEVEKIYIDGNHLIIKHRNGFDYDIALARLDNYKGIVGWIAHLNEKNWFTNDVLECFINVLDGHFDGIITKSR